MTDDWKQDRIRAAHDGRNPTVLAKLPESFAVIGDAQYLPGYCVLLVDDPAVDRLTDLPRDRRLRFLESMDRLGEAIQRACTELDPEFRRLNYEILGNTDAYLHAHIFARYEWEPTDRIGGPVWRYDKELFYGGETALGPQNDELRQKIIANL
ncbi:HIT family protein [Flexivirga alba]|uniref:HIT family protein n=1 Tax=Flexivirga alba TaxID=702742 RepID=A0ABW2AJE3_9MICO